MDIANEVSRALDNLKDNEEHVRFQRLAVVLARQRWPDLVASHRKKDLGADAFSRGIAAKSLDKALACSLTATLEKVRTDAASIRDNFGGTSLLIFSTSERVTNETAEKWRRAIQDEFNFDLWVVEREDILTSMLSPRNHRLCAAYLRLSMPTPRPTPTFESIAAAARETAESWKRALPKGHLIALRAARLDPETGSPTQILNLNVLASLARGNGARLLLEGPAGAGKTTTLIQLAEAVNATGAHAVLVQVPEWIRSGAPILQHISGTGAFLARQIQASDLARVARPGQFALLLNGWNEIPDAAATAAVEALQQADRDLAACGLLLATRAHHVAAPLPGAVRTRLLPLQPGQRAEYLRSRLGDSAGALQRRLERDPALEGLTRTPLILEKVISLFEAGAHIPTTRFGILDAVVTLVESTPEHQTQIRLAPLLGCARPYLIALARRMTESGGAYLPETHARAVARDAASVLLESGQIASLPEPASVLAGLCAHHLLERLDERAASYRFAHQQFQEFFAASYVSALLSHPADANALRPLTTTCINRPEWDEPVRMLAEHLGTHRGEGLAADVAIARGKALVEAAVGVDLVFAAELARLCGPSVWSRVQPALEPALRSWRASPSTGHSRCALAAMIETGAAAFQDVLIPLVSSQDQQVRLNALDAAKRFRPTVLGDAWRERASGWHEDVRVDLVSQLLQGYPDPEAIAFALADPSTRVRAAAIHALLWIGRDDDALRLLDSLSPEARQRVLASTHHAMLPSIVQREATDVLWDRYKHERDPTARLRLLHGLHELGEPVPDEDTKRLLGELPLKQLTDGVENLAEGAVARLRRSDPLWVSRWVSAGLATNLLSPRWRAHVAAVPQELLDQLLTRFEQEDLDGVRSDGMASVIIAGADLAVAERVFTRLCVLRRQTRADPKAVTAWRLQRQLDSLYGAFPPTFAVLAATRSTTPQSLAELEVVAHAFSQAARTRSPLTGVERPLRERLRGYLLNGVSMALEAEDFFGDLKADFASALSLVASADDAPILRAIALKDVQRVREGRAAYAAGDRSDRGQGGMHSWASWNAQSIARLPPSCSLDILLELLNEAEYERDVAEALVLPAAPKPSMGFALRFQYEDIWHARATAPAWGMEEDRRRRIALALRRRVEEVKDAGGPSATYRLSALVTSLATIDGRDSRDLVLEVLEHPDEWNAHQRTTALQRLLLAGAELPADRTIPLLDASIKALRGHFAQDSLWMVKRFLCVLPFVDQPAKGLHKIDEIRATVPVPYHDMEGVLEAIGRSRSEAGLRYLEKFQSDHAWPHVTRGWIEAVAAIDSPAAHSLLLGLLQADWPNGSAQRASEGYSALAKVLAELARDDRNVAEAVFTLCAMETSSRRRAALADIVHRLGTPEALSAGLDLIDDASDPPIPYDLSRALEAVFLRHQPHGQMKSAYTLVPQASNEIRERLFQMAVDDARRSRSALALLGVVEEWRLEHGRPAGEPRHPAIESGRPWPLLASGAGRSSLRVG